MEEDLVEKIKLNRINCSKNNQVSVIEKLKKYGVLEDGYKNKYYPEEISIVATLKNSRRPSSEADFIGLGETVKDIAKLNLEMNRKLLASKPIPYKIFVYSVDFIKTKIFGKEAYSIEDIFDRQINNIKNLDSNLTGIIFSSRKELGKLIKYRGEVNKEWGGNIKKYNKLEKEGKIRGQLYLEADEEFKSTKKGDEKYFTLKGACENLKRELDGISHQKDLAANKIKDRDKEDNILRDLEDMLTTGIKVCETVSDKTSGILRYITNTKKQWDTLVSQGRIIEALYESVAMLGDYSNNLHGRLNEGIKKMGGVANNPNILNSYYLKTHKGIKQIADNVSMAHFNRVENLDDQMNEYLNSTD